MVFNSLSLGFDKVNLQIKDSFVEILGCMATDDKMSSFGTENNPSLVHRASICSSRISIRS